MDNVDIIPGKHFVTSFDKMQRAIASIKLELSERLAVFKEQGKLLEAARLEARTNYDSKCSRRPASAPRGELFAPPGRKGRQRPWTLLDYFPGFHHLHRRVAT